MLKLTKRQKTLAMIIILDWKNSLCDVHFVFDKVIFKSYKEGIEDGKYLAGRENGVCIDF